MRQLTEEEFRLRIKEMISNRGSASQKRQITMEPDDDDEPEKETNGKFLIQQTKEYKDKVKMYIKNGFTNQRQESQLKELLKKKSYNKPLQNRIDRLLREIDEVNFYGSCFH